MSGATNVLETPVAKVRDQIARACAEARRDPAHREPQEAGALGGAGRDQHLAAVGRRRNHPRRP